MGRSDLPRTILTRLLSIARWGEISYAEAHPATSSRVLLCQRPTVGRYKWSAVAAMMCCPSLTRRVTARAQRR